MANIKKLNQEQEYELARLNYLGINRTTLTRKFEVSEATVYNISKKLQSELAEKMKGMVTPTKTPFERGLEYLVSEIKTDKNARYDEDLFVPLVKESLDKIKFKEYMETTSSYDNLIRAVFGEAWYFEGNGAYGLFADYLSNLDFNKKTNKDKLINEFSENLKQRLRKGYFAIEVSDLKKKVIEDTLATLSKREAEILKLYFGINCENSTLEEIADKFNFTRERTRQTKEKAIRRLRHTSRNQSLRYLHGHSDEEVSRYVTELKIKERVEEELQQRTEQIKYEHPLNVSIDELDLSVRAYNCLKSIKVKTIGELIGEWSEEKLLKSSLVSRRTIDEIYQELSKYNLSLRKN